MKIIEVVCTGKKVCIPIDQIRGVTEFIGKEVRGYSDEYNSFICTGCGTSDREDGWYCDNTYEEVKAMLENA